MGWEGDNVLRFSLEGAPRGKGRPFFTTKGGYPRAITDKETRRYENSIREVAIKLMGDRPPLTGPLSVSMRFRFPVPASAPKYVRAEMLAGERAPIVRPDLDNLAKAILDAVAVRPLRPGGRPSGTRGAKTEALMFLNDWQVTRMFLTKIYAERPGVDVRIEAFNPQETTDE